VVVETIGLGRWARLHAAWSRSRSFFLLSCLVGVAAFAFFAMLVSGTGGRSTRILDDSGQTLAAILAGCAARYRARRETDRIRKFWIWLSASAFAWAAGQVVW